MEALNLLAQMALMNCGAEGLEQIEVKSPTSGDDAFLAILNELQTRAPTREPLMMGLKQPLPGEDPEADTPVNLIPGADDEVKEGGAERLEPLNLPGLKQAALIQGEWDMMRAKGEVPQKEQVTGESILNVLGLTTRDGEIVLNVDNEDLNLSVLKDVLLTLGLDLEGDGRFAGVVDEGGRGVTLPQFLGLVKAHLKEEVAGYEGLNLKQVLLFLNRVGKDMGNIETAAVRWDEDTRELIAHKLEDTSISGEERSAVVDLARILSSHSTEEIRQDPELKAEFSRATSTLGLDAEALLERGEVKTEVHPEYRASPEHDTSNQVTPDEGQIRLTPDTLPVVEAPRGASNEANGFVATEEKAKSMPQMASDEVNGSTRNRVIPGHQPVEPMTQKPLNEPIRNEERTHPMARNVINDAESLAGLMVEAESKATAGMEVELQPAPQTGEERMPEMAPLKPEPVDSSQQANRELLADILKSIGVKDEDARAILTRLFGQAQTSGLTPVSPVEREAGSAFHEGRGDGANDGHNLNLAQQTERGSPSAEFKPEGPFNPRSNPLSQRVVDQIVQKAVLIRGEGTQRMSIDLKPEFLGRLHMEVSVKDGQVAVRLTAENPHVRGMVQNNLESLREAFREQGMNMREFSVTVGQNQEHDQTSFRRGREADVPFHLDGDEDSSEVSPGNLNGVHPISSSILEMGRVDLFA